MVLCHFVAQNHLRTTRLMFDVAKQRIVLYHTVKHLPRLTGFGVVEGTLWRFTYSAQEVRHPVESAFHNRKSYQLPFPLRATLTPSCALMSVSAHEGRRGRGWGFTRSAQEVRHTCLFCWRFGGTQRHFVALRHPVEGAVEYLQKLCSPPRLGEGPGVGLILSQCRA